MKKNLFRYPLMAALACGLSMGFTACSDDDKSDNNGSTDSEVLNAEQTDEAIKAWSWVNVLTDETEQGADWAKKTYTATIGEQSSNNPNARLIYVANLDDAKTSFASISGCTPEELNGSKTVSAGQYGSMVWNISAQGAPNIATVEVNSSLLPRLQQIIYCTEEQAPDNATAIVGNCYYRLGDVVEDDNGYFWVCVQPSFLGKKNKDSYWVNIFNGNEKNGRGKNTGLLPGIPQKNIYSKYDNKYNGNTILLPTGLKMDRKQNYNLANLMWAVLDPDKYLQTVGENATTGLAGLPLEYHKENYLKKLSAYWEEAGVFEKLFNCSPEDLKKLKHFHFFYYGYHWKVGSTAGVWLYTSNGYEKNYTGNLDKDDTLYEMKKAGFGFDVRRYAGSAANPDCASTNQEKMAPAKQFDFDSGDAYWVIRVATGKQLDSGYNPYEKFNWFHFDPIFIFNKKCKMNWGERYEPYNDNEIGQGNFESLYIGEEGDDDYKPVPELEDIELED